MKWLNWVKSLFVMPVKKNKSAHDFCIKTEHQTLWSTKRDPCHYFKCSKCGVFAYYLNAFRPKWVISYKSNYMDLTCDEIIMKSIL
jgi:hypothetical protein